MVAFSPTASAQLYAVPAQDLWIALYLPTVPVPLPSSITLAEAFGGDGTFVLAAAPGLDIDRYAAAIVEAVPAALRSAYADRGIVWLTNPLRPAQDIQLVGLRTYPDRTVISPGGDLTLVPNNLFLTLSNGVEVTLDGDAFALSATSGQTLGFTGSAAPPDAVAARGSLPFNGPTAGSVVFPVSIARDKLLTKLRWGFQLLCPADENGGDDVRSQWYPLAEASGASARDMIAFQARIDPSDPTNIRLAGRTRLGFTETGGPTVELVSGFRDSYGRKITLTPVTSGNSTAGLTLALGNPAAPSRPDFVFGPDGDFLFASNVNSGNGNGGDGAGVLCGLSPTEVLLASAGDRIRFTANRPAFVPDYPPPTASTLGPPIDPTAVPLTDRYRTAWAAVVRAQGQAQYSAQPKGASLYGFDDVVSKTGAGLLGPVRYWTGVSDTTPFPLVPYGLAKPDEYGTTISFSEKDIAGVEQFAVTAARRTAIGPPSGRPARDDPGTTWTTTPTGLLATVDPGTGVFTSVVLGVNRAVGGGQWLMFNDPDPVLCQALQTSDLFLVAVDPKHLGVGKPSPRGTKPPPPDGTATFYHTMSIEGWEITAKVGEANTYGDYRNVLIVKGCRGKLVDLVAKPSSWTQATDFSIRPGGAGAELTVLSQWLADYIRAGIDQPSDWFDTFGDIATREDWTGVLVLKASLTALPGDLAGLLSVIDKDDSYAHHFGITISPIGITGKDQLAISGSSSLFELVDYVNPALPGPDPVAPLPPAGPGPYDFQLLTLRALFENTSVRSFDGVAQLTLGEFFGDQVTAMNKPDDIYHTIFLTCAYQKQGDVGAFVLNTTDDNLFTLDSDVLGRVEVTKAQMVTVDATTLRFGLWGFLDFQVLRAVDETTGEQNVPFDLFGFGAALGSDAPRSGLNFADLAVVMDNSVTPSRYTFDVSAITFDVSRSTPRPGSLYQALGLRLKGLLHGSATNDPAAQDYLQVPTSAPLSGVTGKQWYALEFQVDLGTIGALAGNVGLSAGMVAAWAPGAGRSQSTTLHPYDAMAGLRLPGVTSKGKGLTLQGVLALSVGDMRLAYQKAGSKDQRYWVLWLNDIALKFLGLLKIPPNGAVGFACFGGTPVNGNPQGIGWYAVYNQDKPKLEIR
jgi:hypothetical protein